MGIVVFLISDDKQGGRQNMKQQSIFVERVSIEEGKQNNLASQFIKIVDKAKKK